MKKVIKLISLILSIAILLSYNIVVFANDKENTEPDDNITTKAATVAVSSDIESGTYEIYTCVSDTKVMDIQGVSTANCANVYIYERANKNNQKFQITLNDDETYTIMATHSGKVLDVQSGGKTNGTNVWQYEKNGTDAQKWILQSCGNGYYNIISKLNGLYLDIAAGLAKDGQNIQVYEGNGTNAQKFKLEKIQNTYGTKTLENGIYKIYSQITSNRLLEVPSSSTSNSTIFKTAENTNRANQKFNISYNNDGTYSITVLHTGKAMDVRSGAGQNGTPVQQYDYNGTDAQKWIIIKNDDNTYSLVSKCNGLALDIVGASSTVGANVQTYHLNNSKAQKFIFEICEPERGTQSIEDRNLQNIKQNKWKQTF